MKYLKYFSLLIFVLMLACSIEAADFGITVKKDTVLRNGQKSVTLTIRMNKPSNNVPYTYRLHKNNMKDSLIQKVIKRIPEVKFTDLPIGNNYYILIHDQEWKNVDGQHIK